MVVYNCQTEIIAGDKTIYRQSSKFLKEGLNRGNSFIDAKIPEDAFGTTITVRCIVPDGANLTKLENVRLMPTEYSLRYPLINHEMDFIFCTTIVFVSFIAILLMVSLRKFNTLEREGLYLFSFFFLTGIWELGSNDILYIFINNHLICSNIEYFAMFLMPVPFCAFLSLEFQKLYRIIFKVLAAVFGVVFLTVITLNLTTNLHFYKFTHYERYLIVGGLIITVISLLTYKEKKSYSEKIIKIGTICSISVMMIEVIRYELKDTSYLFRTLFSTSLAVFGVMIFVFSLLYGYYIKFSTEMMRKRSLEQVAFTDGMTGISNRTAVIKYLNELNQENDFSIVFFDVNDLKKANDVYGHETGDKLISIVASAISDSFEDDDGFYGRYGGDEFVAGYFRNSETRIEKSIESFNRIISEINKEKALPFDVRVAYGSCINDPGSPMEPDKVLKSADEKADESEKSIERNKERKEKTLI